MNAMKWRCQSVTNLIPMSLLCNIMASNVSPQPGTPIRPNTFSRGRCLLLIRFFVILAFGATMFQAALFVQRYLPSELLVLSLLLAFSVLLFIGASIDFLRILKLRSEARRIETQ